MISVQIYNISSGKWITLQLDDKLCSKVAEIDLVGCDIQAETEGNHIRYTIANQDADMDFGERIVQGDTLDKEATRNAISELILEFDKDSAQRIIHDTLKRR